MSDKKMGQDYEELMSKIRAVPGMAECLDSFSSTVGSMVLFRRMSIGLTQSELAKLAGTTQARISEIESGSDGIKASTYNKVFHVLQLTKLNPEYNEEAAGSYVTV